MLTNAKCPKLVLVCKLVIKYFYAQCNYIVPENIQTSPTEGILSNLPTQPLWKFQFGITFSFNVLVFEDPSTLMEFDPIPVVREYGYFLQLRNVYRLPTCFNFQVNYKIPRKITSSWWNMDIDAVNV